MRVQELFESSFTFKRIRSARAGGRIGELNAPGSLLIKVFGKPTFIKSPHKSSMEWNMRFSNGVEVSLYDYKHTNTYDPNLPSPEELLQQPLVDWGISGERGRGTILTLLGAIADKLPKDEFIKFVLQTYKREATIDSRMHSFVSDVITSHQLVDAAKQVGKNYPELESIKKSVSSTQDDEGA